MVVIDVDSHFDPGPLTLDEHPLKPYADRFPPAADAAAHAIAGDLLRSTPGGSRPPAEELAVFLNDTNRSFLDHVCAPEQGAPKYRSSADERVAWMDAVGIDFALINPGGYFLLLDFMGDELPAAARRCNDFLAEQLGDRLDRTAPVSIVPLGEPADAVRELERMRSRGSRAFWIRAEPVHGRSLAHPHWDPLWQAATALGMVAILHVGNTPANFDGWANAGWDDPRGTGTGGFFRYANSVRHQAAELLLFGMAYSGAFARHPNLTILTEELQVAWLPHLLWRCASLDPAGPWPYDLRPSELLRRNVRATPLLGMGDGEHVDTMMAVAPEMVVFSSDFPHGEGNGDPIRLYEPIISSWSPERRGWFLGGNMADCFARMGDPVVA